MITGGCLCGAVRYQTDGQPVVGLRCYCRDCQRASGSAGLPVMVVNKKQFSVTGKTGISAVTGGSGRKAIRHFCPDCGSLLFGTPEVAPEIVTVYVGSLDDPSVFKPAFAQFTRDRPAWDQLRDVPEFETVPRTRKLSHIGEFPLNVAPSCFSLGNRLFQSKRVTPADRRTFSAEAVVVSYALM